MASKVVTRIQAASSAVEAAAALHAEETASRLTSLLAPDGGPFTLDGLQKRLGEILQADRVALEGADSAHIEELRDDIAKRERRDAAVEALHERVSRVRGTVEMVLGAGSSAKLFAIAGPTSRNPEVLRRLAERMMARLREDLPQPAEPNPAGLALDPPGWAAVIEPAHAELVAAMAEVYADRRRSEVTFRLKHEALERHNTTYAVVTSILAALYRLAGLRVYAERLRPTQPQPSGGGEAVTDGELPLEPPVPFPQPSGGGDTVGQPDIVPAVLPRRVA